MITKHELILKQKQYTESVCSELHKRDIKQLQKELRKRLSKACNGYRLYLNIIDTVFTKVLNSNGLEVQKATERGQEMLKATSLVEGSIPSKPNNAFTRLTVVDDTGRIVERWNLTKVEESIQDNGRTLKIFISEKG